MHGRLDSREIGDIGDTALSFSEIKALATGNPLLMDKADADAALARLQRAERAWLRNQDTLKHAIAQHEESIRSLTRQAADIDVAIGRRLDTRGDAFAMTVGDRRHDKRADAGRHLKEGLAREIAAVEGLRTRAAHPGSLGGFPLVAAIERSIGKTNVTIILDGVPSGSLQLSAADLRAADPAGLITRLENRLHGLEARRQDTREGIKRARREIAHARQSLGQPFPQAAQLAEARDRARRIDEQLDQMVTDRQPAHATRDQQVKQDAEHSSLRAETGYPARVNPARRGAMAEMAAGTDRRGGPSADSGPQARSSGPADTNRRVSEGQPGRLPVARGAGREPSADGSPDRRLGRDGEPRHETPDQDRGSAPAGPSLPPPARARLGAKSIAGEGIRAAGQPSISPARPWREPRWTMPPETQRPYEIGWQPPQPRAGLSSGVSRSPTSDWRDEAIRPATDGWMPKVARSAKPEVFRSAEHGGMEIGQ